MFILQAISCENLTLTCEIEKDTVSGAVWTMD